MKRGLSILAQPSVPLALGYPYYLSLYFMCCCGPLYKTLYDNRTDSDALFSTNRLFNKNNSIMNDTELTNSKLASLSPALRAVVEQV